MREYAVGEVFQAEDGTWCEVRKGYCSTCHYADKLCDHMGCLRAKLADYSFAPLSEPPALIAMQVDLSAIPAEKREKKVRKMLKAAEPAGVRWASSDAPLDVTPYSNYLFYENILSHGDESEDYRLVRPREWIARMKAQAQRNATSAPTPDPTKWVGKPVVAWHGNDDAAKIFYNPVLIKKGEQAFRIEQGGDQWWFNHLALINDFRDLAIHPSQWADKSEWV